MIPFDFQVTCLKVKVKPLFWAQYVVHFKYFHPLLTCFGQVLLLQRRYTWILHHGGAYMFLKHFLFCLIFTEKYQHFYQTRDGYFIEVENSTSSFIHFFGIYSKTITSFFTQRLNNLSWKNNFWSCFTCYKQNRLYRYIYIFLSLEKAILEQISYPLPRRLIKTLLLALF